MMTIAPPSADPSFNSFLQELHEDSSRRLEELPKPAAPAAKPSSKGPTAAEEAARLEADKAAKIEEDWKAQVKERKRLEREQRAAAEREARAQALLPPPRQKTPEPDTPKSIARKKLLLAEQQRAEERERLRQEELKGQKQWEEKEWGPLLEQNRKEIRERHRKAAEDDVRRLEYEQERMGIEDDASARFVFDLDAECTRRSQIPGHKEAGDGFRNKKIEEERALERRAEEERKLQIRERQKEDLRKDEEYIEWREKVRAERCRQVRIDERDRGGPEVDRLAKIGRDYAREAEDNRRQVLEKQRKRAETLAEERLRNDTSSPREALQEAQRKAEQQAQQRAQEQPIKREAEEFDTILARHRLARQQERKRGGVTPRWGLS